MRLSTLSLALLLAASPRFATAASTPEAGSATRRILRETYLDSAAPMLAELIRFPTVAGNEDAELAQKRWLEAKAKELGFRFRDAGTMAEIDLPGPAGSPVLALVAHGDVVPVEADRWTIPPFTGAIENGEVLGRGAADDKSGIVMALLAMKALADTGLPRTQTVRLLVGSDEESGSSDVTEYLKTNRAPDVSLVVDYEFPATVGEMAFNALLLDAPRGLRPGVTPTKPWSVVDLHAGLSGSIVPDRARIALRWRSGAPDWAPFRARLSKRKLPPGTKLTFEESGPELAVVTHGKSAHGGVNLEGGRNALVALARVMAGELDRSGESELLEFARFAGVDLAGRAFGLGSDPLWGTYRMNVATIRPADSGWSGPLGPGQRKDGPLRLAVIFRAPPFMTSSELRETLQAVARKWNARTGSALGISGYHGDSPLVLDPAGKLVKRLQAAYARATGKPHRPVIAGGGTYAKRLPNALAFGPWFPGKPYPGHDVDEKMPIADLRKGTEVIAEAIADLATAPPLVDPMRP